jgi:hypothetical protein
MLCGVFFKNHHTNETDCWHHYYQSTKIKSQTSENKIKRLAGNIPPGWDLNFDRPYYLQTKYFVLKFQEFSSRKKIFFQKNLARISEDSLECVENYPRFLEKMLDTIDFRITKITIKIQYKIHGTGHFAQI